MKKLKVRKIGNSLGSIFPKDWEVHDGELLSYTVDKKNHRAIIDLSKNDLEYDRALIEEGFKDFETGNFATEKEMKAIFGKYGWGK